MTLKKLFLHVLFIAILIIGITTSVAATSKTVLVNIKVTNDYKTAYEILELVNKERTKAGKTKLTMDKDLMETAMLRASEAVIKFSHTRPDGSAWYTAEKKDIGSMGENLAIGFGSTTKVMDAWMKSEGHRANILKDKYRTVGIGVVKYNGSYYWAQFFGEENLNKATSIPKNKTVTRKIKALKENVKDEYNFKIDELKSAETKPKKVTGLKSKKQTTTSITLNWSKATGANGYEVYQYNTSKKKWEKIGTTTKTSYEIKKLKEGTKYKFKVRAYKTVSKKKYCGSYSSELQATTKISNPSKVKGLKAKKQTTTTVTLSWSKASGATGYEVYKYNTSKKKWEKVGSTTKTSYTVKKLKAGTKYKFKVRAYKTVNKKKYYGSYSSELQTATKTSTPKITSVTTGSKKANLKWKKVSGATGYEIYMATSKNGKYSKIKTITKASTGKYSKTKLKKNKKYYFKIRTYKTVKGKKIYSSYSTVKSIKIK